MRTSHDNTNNTTNNNDDTNNSNTHSNINKEDSNNHNNRTIASSNNFGRTKRPTRCARRLDLERVRLRHRRSQVTGPISGIAVCSGIRFNDLILEQKHTATLNKNVQVSNASFPKIDGHKRSLPLLKSSGEMNWENAMDIDSLKASVFSQCPPHAPSSQPLPLMIAIWINTALPKPTLEADHSVALEMASALCAFVICMGPSDLNIQNV